PRCSCSTVSETAEYGTRRSVGVGSRLSCSIGVRAVAYRGDLHCLVDVVDEVQDSGAASTGAPGWRKRWVEGFAHTPRVVQQRPGDEFVCGGCDLFGESLC